VAKGRLELATFTMSVWHHKAPPLFGVEPRMWARSLAIYDLHAPVAFTGAMLVGDEYGDGGWEWVPSATGFRVLHHLVFDQGRLVSAEDRSKPLPEFSARIKAARSREKATACREEPSKGGRKRARKDGSK
jgi:hypothetical protein